LIDERELLLEKIFCVSGFCWMFGGQAGTYAQRPSFHGLDRVRLWTRGRVVCRVGEERCGETQDREWEGARFHAERMDEVELREQVLSQVKLGTERLFQHALLQARAPEVRQRCSDDRAEDQQTAEERSRGRLFPE
jgi:hypothetical protein